MKINLISITQYAKQHGVSRQYIHQLIKAGRLDALRIGYNFYLKPDEKIKK